MKNRILLLVLIFLVVPSFVFSLKTFVIKETEKISLQASATDPDRDKLTTIYSAPLNDKGEWQTNYGDSGEYKSTVTVSDGITNVSEDVVIVIERKEEKPVIDSSEPESEIVSINEGDAISFKISAHDPNKDTIIYQWLLDNKMVEEGHAFEYQTYYGNEGNHKVTAVVSDGKSTISRNWNVNIEKVDIRALLDSINDVNVNENEIARLELPDFSKYGLNYTISEPIGNKNKWKTTYDDSGTYDIKVHAEGKGFIGDKNVKVVVNEVDRPLTFDKIGNAVVKENEEVVINLNANDPDGDEITYSAGNLPEGATLNGTIFSWTPSYDAVKKGSLVESVMDRFGTLTKNYFMQFAASSRDKKVVQNIVITVRDVNRAPVIDDLSPITVNEGELLRIIPNAYDPDGDKITLSYSGFISKDNYKSNFGDVGTYYVKVTASDGNLESSKTVQININHVNRAPEFDKFQEIKAKEGDDIALVLNAHDADGDNLTYSIDNPPNGSRINGNVFLWTPAYGLVDKKQTRVFDLVFAASDGKVQTRQIAKAEIGYKNRQPKITDASKNIIARVNQPVLMYVKATDDDGDSLTYTWDFGFLEKYKATPAHQRIFTTRGPKIVKVIVSDGTDEAEQLINVNVV